jgi:arylsulfatase A-like enzyme
MFSKYLSILFFICAFSLKAQQPNIVWVVSEDNSTHYMKMFNEHGIETPNIEKLAKQGIQFNRAFSNAAVCSAARSTLITGVFGPKLGTHYHRADQKITLPNNIKIFPEYLKKAGYYTTNNAKEDYNIYKSENVWDDSSTKASWRNRKKGQPFFHVYNMHVTHEGSLHFTENEMKTNPTKNSSENVFVAPNHPNTKTFKYTNAFYKDRIQMMDNQVGELVKELEKDGLLENTIIFYYGDHGGVLPNSKGYLKETGLHVPLVVYVPQKLKNVSPFPIGSSTDKFISFIDLSATVLNLAGIKIPKTIDGKPFLGNNASNKVAENEVTFGYADRFDEKYDMVRSVRKGNLKYIRNFQPFNVDGLMNNYRYKQLAYKEWKQLFDDKKLNATQSLFFEPKLPEEIYDLEKDPYETNNLVTNSAFSKELKQLRECLNSWIKKMPDLSFYPEHYLIDNAFSNPIEFGEANKKNISRYLKISNLQLLPFSKAEPKLLKLLKSSDEITRYWALIVCTSFGEKAASLSNEINQIMISDSYLLNKMRAAEFLGILGIQDTSKEMLTLLYESDNATESLLILNSMVLQKDFYKKNSFIIKTNKLNKKLREHELINQRLTYLNL